MKPPDDQPPSSRPLRRDLTVVVAAASLLILYGVFWGMPNHWDTAADSVVPVGRLMRKTRDLAGVTAKRYPPLHLMLVRGALAGADVLSRAEPFRSNPKFRDTLYIMAGRLLSAAMGVGLVVCVFLLTRRLFGRVEAFFAAAVLALSPVTQYYAKNANLDVPYVFWLALTLLFLERLFASGRSVWLVWAGLGATAAVCAKDQAYGFVVLLPVPVLLSLRSRRGSWGAVFRIRNLWVAAGVSLVAFALVHNILFAPEAFREHLRVIAGPASESWRETAPNLLGQARLLVETVLQTFSASTPPAFAACVVGIVLACRLRKGRWILWGPLGYWLTFLTVIGYVYPRFTLPILLALSPFGGLALGRLWRFGAEKARWGRVAACLVAADALTRRTRGAQMTHRLLVLHDQREDDGGFVFQASIALHHSLSRVRSSRGRIPTR